MSASEDRGFNWFKGSVYILVGLALMVYVLYYSIFAEIPVCACPSRVAGDNPVRSALPLVVYSTFVIFVAMIGVILVVLGYYTRKYGRFTWKRFSLNRKSTLGEL